MKPVPLRLGVRPSGHPRRAGAAPLGLHRLPPAPSGRREAWVRVPQLDTPQAPVALALLLHGSGGEPSQALQYLEPFTSRMGVLVVAPASRDYTWDAILGRRGPDVEAIDQALHWAFERFLVDRERLIVGGFSDGASYALALGLANGDVFRSVVALSPGFIPAAEPVERPRIYVSHGTGDDVLPIERCSRRLVPALRDAGYPVKYDEFTGGHVIPRQVAQQACGWMLQA